nr:hypothetical protein [uncultured Devosia sp.]
MAASINRWNLYEQPIASQMEYRQARRAEAREMMGKTAQLASSFASISSSRVIEEGNLFSRMATERMMGQRVSKSA